MKLPGEKVVERRNSRLIVNSLGKYTSRVLSRQGILKSLGHFRKYNITFGVTRRKYKTRGTVPITQMEEEPSFQELQEFPLELQEE